jgi:hypothetical protein
MSSSEGFEKLKSIGAQKIHEKTHIAKYHVQSLLHNNFDEMTKIQFLGFVSILEREYGVHLDDLRERGLSHFLSRRVPQEENKVFLEPKKTASNAKLYIVLLIVLFVFGMVYNFSKTTQETIPDLAMHDNETIKIVQEEILKIPLDTNLSDNAANEEVLEIEQEPKPELSLKIIPNAKLWLGYIDLATHKKSQITTAEAIELDPTKEWLLSLGHGDISVDVHGTLQKYNSANNIRFLYRDGVLQEISFKEFKELNKGAVW